MKQERKRGRIKSARTTSEAAPVIDEGTTQYPEAVNHPAHYNRHPAGVECIDIVEHLSFNVGNAMKYLWRCGLKGYEIEDLEKARWYVNREIERLSKGGTKAKGDA